MGPQVHLRMPVLKKDKSVRIEFMAFGGGYVDQALRTTMESTPHTGQWGLGLWELRGLGLRGLGLWELRGLGLRGLGLWELRGLGLRGFGTRVLGLKGVSIYHYGGLRA